MYAQQQQHHLVPFANLQQQQPYYSSNPFLWRSFPSESSIHPPGTDPVANSNVFLPTSTLSAAPYGAPQSTDSQNWIAKQADFVRYDVAVGSSAHETSAVSSSLPSTWNGTWSHQFFTNNATAMLPNQTKVTKSMRCEVCKIDCNSKDVYEKHILGKKHKKNLQIQANPTNTILSGPSQENVQSQRSSIQGLVLTGGGVVSGLSQANVQSQTSSIQGLVLTGGGVVGNELESKKRKLPNGGVPIDSVKVCTVCNTVCNSQEVFSKHLAGKKHAAQVALMSNNGIGPYIAAFKSQGVGPWKKAPKKIKVAQPAWCDSCQVNCNSRDMYIAHLAGKKHLNNLEKLSKPKNDAAAGATTANASQRAANPIIGLQEKPDADKLKPQKAPELDIEAKKRKVVEGGAAAAAVRMCTLCNVVCNSQTVFNAHLAGHKHAAMVKKQNLESRGATTG